MGRTFENESGLKLLFWGGIFCAFLLLLPALTHRLHIEKKNNIVAFCADAREIQSLARQNGVSVNAYLGELKDSGLSALAVAELTGKDLSSGMLAIRYAPAMAFETEFASISQKGYQDRAALVVEKNNVYLDKIKKYLYIKFPLLSAFENKRSVIFILPFSIDELADSALLPDFSALSICQSLSIPALFRPSNATGVTSTEIASSLIWLKEQYPVLAGVVPAGLIAPGYPETERIAAVIKSADMIVTQVEFMRQIGSDQLLFGARESILPLHSLVRDEMITKRMTRAQVQERMFRAAQERSIRILFLRSYEIYSGNRAPFFKEDMDSLRGQLRTRGYEVGWPKPIEVIGKTWGAAFALALVFIITLFSYLKSTRLISGGIRAKELVFLFILVMFTGTLLYKIPAASRLLGGVVAAFIATWATIVALDATSRPFLKSIMGLLIILLGGSAIAAFYGTHAYMLRLSTFSGVKLTLLLPPVLLLFHDFKKGRLGTSIEEIREKPVIWGELIVCLLLLCAAAILTLRSDNFGSVPAWEIQFRDFLERALVIRPRTKEFLIGYPSLVLYWVTLKANIFLRYQEILRLAVSIGFASAINTFCHFHTPLLLTVIRVINGWWLGILLGILLAMFVYLYCRYFSLGASRH